MAGTNSNYTENKLIDTLLRNGAAYQPAGLYLTLFTTVPDFETGTGGTEAAGTTYVRKAITFDVADAGATASADEITWTVDTDIDAGTYTGWAIYDAITDGELLFGDSFASNKVLNSTGDTITFAEGAITYSLT